MDALKFLNEKHRMCNLCELCVDCPMGAESSLDCRYIDFAKQVSVVEKWSKEHPVKTRMSEFLKQYPNAVVFAVDDLPVIKPCELDYSVKDRLCKNGVSCTECREKYWLEEIE